MPKLPMPLFFFSLTATQDIKELSAEDENLVEKCDDAVIAVSFVIFFCQNYELNLGAKMI